MTLQVGHVSDLLRLYFIGFIEYQGQIAALESNILKYATHLLYSAALSLSLSLCPSLFGINRVVHNFRINVRMRSLLALGHFISFDTERV